MAGDKKKAFFVRQYVGKTKLASIAATMAQLTIPAGVIISK